MSLEGAWAPAQEADSGFSSALPLCGLLCRDAHGKNVFVGSQKSAKRHSRLPKLESRVHLFYRTG